MNFKGFNLDEVVMLIAAMTLWTAIRLHQGFYSSIRVVDAAGKWAGTKWRRWAASLSPGSVERFEAGVVWFRLLADLVTATGNGGLLVVVVTAAAAGLSVACALIQKARK